MKPTIKVACRQEGAYWLCDVAVAESETRTRHEVRVSPDELARYGGAEPDVGQLVERSFQFLLARESKESILRTFKLSDIASYFPEFDKEFRS